MHNSSVLFWYLMKALTTIYKKIFGFIYTIQREAIINTCMPFSIKMYVSCAWINSWKENDTFYIYTYSVLLHNINITERYINSPSVGCVCAYINILYIHIYYYYEYVYYGMHHFVQYNLFEWALMHMLALKLVYVSSKALIYTLYIHIWSCKVHKGQVKCNLFDIQNGFEYTTPYEFCIYIYTYNM